MVYLVFGILRVLLALGVGIAVFLSFQNKLPKIYSARLAALTLLFAILANVVSGLFPPLKDTVILTALGEKREEAKKEEVYLSGYTVDGEEYNCLESLEIDEGKWFWSGEMYCWRSETDSRQPKGTTRTVVLKLPVGSERTLNFAGDVWRGKVEIKAGGRTWRVDTYSEQKKVIEEPIGASVFSAILFDQLCRLMIYVFLLVAESLILWKLYCKSEQTFAWIARNRVKIIYSAIAYATFILMIHYAGRASLWYDEISQIGFTNGTVAETIQYCLMMYDITPPLPNICATLWYAVAPFGEKWLYLPTITLCALSIYFVGLTGEQICGTHSGILASLLMASSSILWADVAYEYRAYAYFVFFSTLTFYLYIMRNQRKKHYFMIYSISLVGLAMSHYFGMLACAAFFLADIFLIIKREISVKTLKCYLTVGTVASLWFITVIIKTLRYKKLEQIANWYPVPGFAHMKDMLQYLTGEFDLTYCFLGIGIAIVLAGLLNNEEQGFSWQRFYERFSVSIIIGTLLLLMIYGNFVNRESTMWQGRYFTGLIPYIAVLSATAVERVLTVIEKPNTKRIAKGAGCIFLGAICSLNCLSVISTSKSNPAYAYREAADWLYTQSNNIFNDTTVVVLTAAGAREAGEYAKEGWSEYYVSQKGRRDSLNIISQYEAIKEESILRYSKVYIQYSHHGLMSELQAVLDANYKLETDRKDIRIKVYNRK